MNTKAVIFDLDDTLAPEVSYALSGFKAVASYMCEKKKLQTEPDLIYKELEKLFFADHKMVFNRFLKEKGLPDDKASVMELIEVYRNHFPDISYYDDVLPSLKMLKEKGIITGILSDGYAVTQRQKVKALGAEKDFDIVILTDELGREAWKPDPRGFEIIEEEYSLKPSEVVYVGDNPEKDFYLKETAGIKTVRIMRENGVYINSPYCRDVREDYRIESLTELEDLI